jgi:CTP:molybdopterin cytidylyltransferase MocA
VSSSDGSATAAFPVACVILSLEAVPGREAMEGGDAACWAAAVERDERVRLLVDAAVQLGISPIVAVMPPGATAPSPARVVTTAKGGADTALRLGASQMANTMVRGLLVWPLEVADGSLTAALAVVDAAKRTRSPVVVPETDGEDGWPVFFARDTWRELLTTAGGARALIRLYESRLHRVAIDSGARVPAPGPNED